MAAGVVFLNPNAGSADATAGRLPDLFPGSTLVDLPGTPKELATAVKQAVADGAAFVAVAGGDGTIRSVAQHLAGTDTPLLPIPGGTKNHFAKDVGIRSLEDAAAAARAGHCRAVDVGAVNDRIFVNNASIGVYPKLVVSREAREHRLPKGLAMVVAAIEQLRRGRRVRVTLNGRTWKAWMLFVGNGRYGEGLLDLADRENLDEHTLDIRLVRADNPLARLRVILAVLLGSLARSPLVIRSPGPSAEVRLRRRLVEVALDGEVEVLEQPLRFESRRGALQICAPSA